MKRALSFLIARSSRNPILIQAYDIVALPGSEQGIKFHSVLASKSDDA
jgi:hypothetical protein